jgi:hypothetical protein
MKVFFLMDSPEYLRFYDTAIDELAARGHLVTLAVMSGRERKPVGLEGLQAHADRVRLAGVVPAHTGSWAGIATGLRATMDFVRFLHPTLAAAPALRARIKRKVLPRAYHWLDRIPSLAPATVRRLLRVLAGFERAIPVHGPIVDMLRAESPDVVLVSPLVAAASEQVDWVKAARACGMRTAVGVASWDNLTNKGLLRIEPDALLVWNEAQRREAVEYHGIPAEKVAVTGAQLFDRWFDRRVSRVRAEFCRRVGLPDERPFVLFTGSSVFISRSDAEVAFVRRWIEALRGASEPSLRDVNILVRPHPYNCQAWEANPLAGVPGVAVYPNRTYSPVGAETRADFFDSLSHAAVVVGINTSAMIEAAIAGKPVCSLLASEFTGTQEGTIHFRHLLPEHGGFLRIAGTLDEHLAQVADRLAHADGSRAETARFVASFIRPHGIDRAATPLFVDAVEALAAKPAPRPQTLPVWAPLAWPVLWLAALPAWAVDRLAAGPLPVARRSTSRALHRGRKIVRGVAVRVATRWQRLTKRVMRLLGRVGQVGQVGRTEGPRTKDAPGRRRA